MPNISKKQGEKKNTTTAVDLTTSIEPRFEILALRKLHSLPPVCFVPWRERPEVNYSHE